MYHNMYRIVTPVYRFTPNVGRRGSVVLCVTYKREVAGSIPGRAEYASTLCS